MLVQSCQNRNQLQQSTESVNNSTSSYSHTDSNQSLTRLPETSVNNTPTSTIITTGSTLPSEVHIRTTFASSPIPLVSSPAHSTTHNHPYSRTHNVRGSSLSDSVNNNTTTGLSGTTAGSPTSGSGGSDPVTPTFSSATGAPISCYNPPTTRYLPSSGNANITSTRAGKVVTGEEDLIENSILSEFDLVASITNKQVGEEVSLFGSADGNNQITPTGSSSSSPRPGPVQQTQQPHQQPVVNNTLLSSAGSLLETSHHQIQGHLSSGDLPTRSPSSSTSLVHSQSVSQFPNTKVPSDAYLSCVRPDMLKNTNMPMGRQPPISAPNTPESLRRQHLQNSIARGGNGRQMDTIMTTSLHTPADKREKMEYNQMMRSLSEKEGRPLSYHGRSGSVCYEHLPPGTLGGVVTGGVNGGTGINNGAGLGSGGVSKRHIMSSGTRSRKESVLLNRRSMPGPYLENRFRDKFDVSDLDTNLPRIDLEAIETHLRQAREEERKRRSDREEIRRRLALESDEMNDQQKPRKNLHSRLQSSMNLQICFMNETASDSESPNSDTEIKGQQPQPASLPCVKAQTPNSEGAGLPSSEDFFARQGRLQAEARQALAQAKEMARLQMTQERDKRSQSPITVMVRNSLEKVGVGLPPDRRRVSRQLLTEMNVAQLQVIVNDLHSHIEKLNETLVSMLLERDDLHMEQDSMLVDIEDLTRYLAAKYNSPHQSLPLISASQSLLGKK